MQGWSKALIYSGVGLLGVGFLLVVLAWNGAASVGGTVTGIDYTQGQIPYLISGGVGGVALIGAGLTLIIVHTLRQDLADLGGKLDAVVDGVREISRASGGGPTAVPANTDEIVVAGQTTFHAPTCRLVEGRQDLQVMGVANARDRGLAPCRVCNPDDRDKRTSETA